MPLLDILTRLLVAAVLSGMIGFEREYRNKPAGLRTNMLVGLGTAVVCLVAVELLNQFPDGVVNVSNLAGALMPGIGFLGAGTILHDKGSVYGLTTAASMWLVASIGIASGMGLYAIAFSATILGLVILSILGRFHFSGEKN